MAIRDVHYLPGGYVCVVGPGVGLITDLAPTSAVVTACWETLAAGGDADTLAEIIRRDVPPGSARVALAGPVGPAVRILLGGAGAHAVVAGGAAADLRAPGSSWLDEQYPNAVGVRLSVQDLGAEATDVDGALPIRAGVALASIVILGVVALPAAAAAADSAQLPKHGAPPVDAAPNEGVADDAAPDAAEWLAPEAFGVNSDEEIEPPAEPIVEPTGVAPTVLAVSCPNGHLGPPYDETCRICGAPIPPQGPFSAPRPSLGVLQLSSGATVPLDRDIVLGRGPSAGAAAADENVRLVRVPSPNNDISRNHVLISLEGWHVLATDLGSTNGTLVTPPGGETVRLSPHEAVTIVPGTVVALADEIEMQFDPRG
jgi:FHA domain